MRTINSLAIARAIAAALLLFVLATTAAAQNKNLSDGLHCQHVTKIEHIVHSAETRGADGSEGTVNASAIRASGFLLFKLTTGD